MIDLRGTRRWDLGSLELTTYIDIHNLLNLKQSDVPIHLNLSTQQYEPPPQVGIVPSLGIKMDL